VYVLAVQVDVAAAEPGLEVLLEAAQGVAVRVQPFQVRIGATMPGRRRQAISGALGQFADIFNHVVVHHRVASTLGTSRL